MRLAIIMHRTPGHQAKFRMNTYSAIILAGGKATRMGGLDKGLVPWHGKPLIEHVLARVGPQVDDIVISCNRHPDQYAGYGTCQADTTGDYAGPLAGIAACLPLCRHDAVLVVACDMPLLPHDLVMRLGEALTADIDVAVAHDGEQLQPLAMLLRRRTLPALHLALAQGQAAVHRWALTQAHRIVPFGEPEAFRNFNTLEELGNGASIRT